MKPGCALGVIIFVVYGLIYSFVGLGGDNPTGALWATVFFGVVLCWIGYQIYKSFQVGDDKEFDWTSKNMHAYRMEKKEIEDRYRLSLNGSDGDIVRKTGIYSNECQRNVQALNERYGFPGTDSAIRAEAKKEAWDRGVRNKEGLRWAGEDAVKEYHKKRTALKLEQEQLEVIETPKQRKEAL